MSTMNQQGVDFELRLGRSFDGEFRSVVKAGGVPDFNAASTGRDGGTSGAASVRVLLAAGLLLERV